MKIQTKKLGQLTNIRAVAILLVVLGHSIILYSPGWRLYETVREAPVLAWLKQIINVALMPLFFSLSGYLFVFTHQKKRGLLHLLRSKSLRLMVPYFLIGGCFLIPLRFLIRYPGYQEKTIADLVSCFLLGTDVGHLWFLSALFFIFLLAELILTIAEKLPYVQKFPEIFLVLASGALYLEGYRVSFGYSPLQSAYWNLIWFALGYFLNVHHDTVKCLYGRKWAKWLLLGINVITALFCSTKASVGLLLRIALPTLYILNAYGAMPEKDCKLTDRISKNSFGIYLFHSPLIYITFATIPDAAPAIVVFLNFVVFGLLAYWLTNLVWRIKLGFVIGE